MSAFKDTLEALMIAAVAFFGMVCFLAVLALPFAFFAFLFWAAIH